MKRVGIVGCGAIGSLVSEAIDRRIVECDELVLYDRSVDRAERLRASLKVPTHVVESVNQMIALKPEVVVEAASQQAVKEYAHSILTANIDLIVMSVGALLDLRLPTGRIHVPSGAIGGLDALRSACLVGVDEVVLTTRKSSTTLNSKGQASKTIYVGSAERAARLFPKEMNVAATLALAVRPAKVEVRVVSDPTTDRNVHEISVKWKCGEMFFRFSNDPHPANLKTSALAAWSAIYLLKDLLAKRR